MSKALIVIDYTNDFVSSSGRLTCGEPGQAIEDDVTNLTSAFILANDFVVFAVDVHEEGDKYHPEAALFPPHNIRGTKGRHLYGKLGQYFDLLSHEGLPSHVKWMDKTRYSAFAGTDLDIMLRSRGIFEIHLIGVCTDICVLHTAVDAYNLGYQIVVHRRGVASFNEQGHTYALEHFRSVLGAKVAE